MGRADIHRALVKAYLATGATKDAMREAGLLVKSDPGPSVIRSACAIASSVCGIGGTSLGIMCS